MKIPHTIPRNVYEAYKCSFETTQLLREVDRTIVSEDVSWDVMRVPSLKTLALNVIASSWKQNPILDELATCEDKNTLIEILSTDLPFELTIKKIDDEHYWERCSEARWEHTDLSKHGNSWRRRYCEGVMNEYLEKMEPTFFQTQIEECEKLINLVRDFVYTIELRCLQPTKKRMTSLDEEDECLVQEQVVHHIPLEFILPKFCHLTEIRITFGLIYMNDGFEWRDFQISIEDCMSLGRGIKACPNMKKFTLSRSNLDRPHIALLLQGILENDNIEEVNLPHCKLADKEAHAIGEFLSLHKNLKVLCLANNDIGPDGVSGIVYGLLKREQSILKVLDLQLNPLTNAGAFHMCAYLLRNDILEVLDLSACGIQEAGGNALAEVLSSMQRESFTLCVSNNDFGETVGKSFEKTLKVAHFVVGFEARMCNFSTESEYSIYESVLRNKQEKMKEKVKLLFDRPQYQPTRLSI